jgi:hypothetical protein
MLADGLSDRQTGGLKNHEVKKLFATMRNVPNKLIPKTLSVTTGEADL